MRVTGEKFGNNISDIEEQVTVKQKAVLGKENNCCTAWFSCGSHLHGDNGTARIAIDQKKVALKLPRVGR